MFCEKLANERSTCSSELDSIQNQNDMPKRTELNNEIGRTLAHIGDKLNTKYFKEWSAPCPATYTIRLNLARDIAKTLSVVLISGWCDNLR